MEIQFNDGDDGFQEAAALSRIVHHARELATSDSAVMQLLDQLQRAAEAWLARPQFAGLNAPTKTEVTPEAGWWRGLFGPSRQERRLSTQRIAALERAERAERSSFEALAETARVARERDEVRARLAGLQAEVDSLRAGSAD